MRDEISSINMAVGAAHMGVRVATATSGPGFALMVEGIGSPPSPRPQVPSSSSISGAVRRRTPTRQEQAI